MNANESLFTLAHHLTIIIIIMNNTMTNFNIADARDESFHSSVFAGSFMPLRSDWEWNPRSAFNLLPAFIMAMLVLGAMSKLLA